MEVSQTRALRSHRKPTNLTVDADLLREAKELSIPLSQTFEAALAVKVTEARQRRWQEANQSGIDAYNERVEAEGLWSDGRRLF